jgi:peptide/nickel transport system substrate-binding protein/microcin C transport system substrate-binding protein
VLQRAGAALRAAAVAAVVPGTVMARGAAATPADEAGGTVPGAIARDGAWVHGYAAFGEPKYPSDWRHFDYVDPAAPKGGTLYLRNPDRRSSFDKYNPFTTRGNAPAGLAIFMFESLAILSGDELQTMYGLLAQKMLIAPDKSSISFRLHLEARFADGDPVLAEDVKFSFEQQSGPQASPASQMALASIERVVVLDERSIRFELREHSNDALFTAGGLAVFSRKWGLQPDGSHKRFDEIVTEYPITSGPYTIASASNGRRIEFRRNPDYWARDLPARRGAWNFDRVVYRYYQDQAVATEAFKAGEFDIVKIYSARVWARQLKGRKWDEGLIRNQLFRTDAGQALQSTLFNLRRPLFQDRRVRHALSLTWDFDTLNRYHLYKRAYSLFNNSQFAAVGRPSPGELALLEPYRAELPAEVFGAAFRPADTGAEPERLRRNLLLARDLLKEAGWKLDAEGQLRNARGELFEMTYLTPGEATRQADWERNLNKLGITLKTRAVDFALYRRRLEQYDFDLITIAGGEFTIPSAIDYISVLGSASADQPGNNNFRGVKSAAVDHVLQAMARAQTLQQLEDACRALDRIVMWSFWQIPELYSDAQPTAYWTRFGMPKVQARYFSIDTASGWPAWPLETWWIKDPAKR